MKGEYTPAKVVQVFKSRMFLENPEVLVYEIDNSDWYNLPSASNQSHVPFGFRGPVYTQDYTQEGNPIASVLICPEIISMSLADEVGYRSGEYLQCWAMHMAEHVRLGPFHGNDNLEAQIDKVIEAYGVDALESMSRIQMQVLDRGLTNNGI